MSGSEVLIKSKRRVRQHGDVFTPTKIVHAMVSLLGLEDVISEVTTTVLEPSVG